MGMINSEKFEFSTIFMQSDGIATCLQFTKQVTNESEIFDSEFTNELDSVVIYTLTSSCYEGCYENFDVLAPIIPYLQTQLLRQDFSDD